MQGAGFSLNPDIVPDLDEALTFMWNFVDDLLTKRESNPPVNDEDKDLLDQLIEATHVENGLSKEELYDLVVLLFGGGYDTSKNALGLIVHILLDRPDDWQRLASDEAFAKKVLNETLRMTNVISTYRIVKDDFVWKDVTIPKGTMLMFPIPLAGQDESVYRDAATFDPERMPEERPFPWGRGIHNCLGQFIARTQIEVALPLIAVRLPDLTRNGEPTWRPFPGIWGLKTLPVRTGKVA